MSTGRPVSALRRRGHPGQHRERPRPRAGPLVHRVVGLRHEEAPVQQRVAAEMPARPVLDPDPLDRAVGAEHQHLVAAVRRLERLLLVHADLDPPLGPVERQVIALDRHIGVERVATPARRWHRGSPRSSCRRCRCPRDRRRRRAGSRPPSTAPRRAPRARRSSRCRGRTRTRPRAGSPCSGSSGTARRRRTCAARLARRPAPGRRRSTSSGGRSDASPCGRRASPRCRL